LKKRAPNLIKFKYQIKKMASAVSGNPFAAWSSVPLANRQNRYQSMFDRRMMVDYIWKNEFTENQRILCGGEAGRLKVKSWVTTLDCRIEREDVIDLFTALVPPRLSFRTVQRRK
jgi:hypothetical protein